MDRIECFGVGNESLELLANILNRTAHYLILKTEIVC